MVFSSISFLFLYLPLVLAGYHLLFLPITLGAKSKFWWHSCNLFLLLVSLVFYFWGEGFLVWIFIATVFIDYFCALLIADALLYEDYDCLKPHGRRSTFQRAVLVFPYRSNLTLLAYFKYFNFGVDTYNALLAAVGISSAQWHSARQVLLPLGISFFTFHSMSYTIDVYRGYVKATRNLIDYGCYVLMFPQLVAGPIVRYSLVSRQLVGRVISAKLFASGIARFVLGLSKKVLIANTAATAADRIFGLPSSELTAGVAWLGIVSYTLQIYFDFSGYSDMAIGLGRMFGFELPVNFNYPYIANSVQNFWKRWHISLSTWFQDYLYIPLGGSRRSSRRTYWNLMTVFFLCGLWHGASWTFVVWGLYHGLFLVIERSGLPGSLLKRFPVGAHVYTLLVVMGGWVLFRTDSFDRALHFFGALAGFGGGSGVYGIQWYLTPDVLTALIAGAIFSMPVLPLCTRFLEAFVFDLDGKRAKLAPVVSGLGFAGITSLFVVCCVTLASGTHNPFIYFRF